MVSNVELLIAPSYKPDDGCKGTGFKESIGEKVYGSREGFHVRKLLVGAKLGTSMELKNESVSRRLLNSVSLAADCKF